MQNIIASWIVFFVVGGISGFLRYGDGLSGHNLDLMIEYSKYLVIVVYVVIALAAYKDSVFQGILSTLIPFYGFYWIFLIADAFMMRAIVAGILVGTGVDFCIWFNGSVQEIMLIVQKWIGSGG